MEKEVSLQDIKAIFDKIAISQAKTDAQMARTDEKLEKLIAETNAQKKETDKQIKALREETDKQIKENARQIKALNKHFGNFTNNQGDMVEEFFFNTVERDKIIYGIQYDYIDTNVANRVGKLQREYDIVAYNGSAVAIIEVKSKAKLSDIDEFEQKIKDFRILFPMYKDHKIYIGIAGLDIDKTIVKLCKAKGYMVLKMSGSVVEPEALELKAY